MSHVTVAPGLLAFASPYLDLDGTALHYLDEGNGDTMLLLHGNPAWSCMYRGRVAASERYGPRDIRGHPAPTLPWAWWISTRWYDATWRAPKPDLPG